MKPKLKITLVLVIALSLIWAAGANAQLTVFNSNVPAGFCQSGLIQQATVDTAAVNSGGTLTMNGITMIVPTNTVVQMPANTLTWAQLFDPAVSLAVYDNTIPAQATPPINHPLGMTGLALADAPATFPPAVPGAYPGPFPSFNAIVFGNIDVKGAAGKGVGAYIVGLILPINQDLGNLGSGFITFIDYTNGRIEVNGTLNTAGTGTVIEINDPIGRFGKAHSPDPRWSADTDNPTILARNGYPMGLPKVAPPAIDPDRPIYNRPLNPAVGAAGHDPFLQAGAPFLQIQMPAKAAPNGAGVTTPDPFKQAPFMIGDYVSWEGILVKFNPSAPITPFNPALPAGAGNLPLNKQIYISAHTLGSDVIEISTAPGTAAAAGPCYLSGPIGHSIVGTGGNVAGINVPPNPALGIIGGNIPLPEPKNNIAVHGWCTDSTNLVDIYAVDINPVTGVEVPRLLGTVLPEPGFAAGKGNKGRFTFNVSKALFGPPTRVYQFVSRHGAPIQLPPQSGLNGAALPVLLSGQYHFPQFGFQFADTAPGSPIIPLNFQVFNFLSAGEGGNPSAGPLNPFPPVTP